MAFFPEIAKIRYEGPTSTNPLSFRHYNAYETIEGADALVLLTEWNEFRALDLVRVGRLLAEPLVIDLRNIYQPAEMAAAGLCYVSIGRPPRARSLRSSS